MNAASELRSSCDLLLRGGSVVTMGRERPVIDSGAIAVVGNRIVDVGSAEELSRYEAVRTIDTTGRVVTPGRSDCHTHLFQTLGKGLAEGNAMWPWLTGFMFPYATEITPDDAEVAVLLGSIQAARAGTTSVCDNHYAPGDHTTVMRVAQAIESVGLRGAVARGIFGEMNDIGRVLNLPEGPFQRSAEEELEITEGCLEARPKGSRVEIWPAPENPTYLHQELFRDSVELARRFGVSWHTHASEASVDPDLYVEHFGIRPMTWLHREGLLGEDATLAHCIWLDEAEIDAVGGTRSRVSHNPVSNQYIACGTMPVRELLEAGAVVGLGTDGSAVMGRDLLEVTKQVMLLHRSTNQDPELVPVETVLGMLHCHGAEYMRHDAGRLEPGRLADMTVVRLDRAHVAPVNRVITALAYFAQAADVEMTIVDGVVIYEDGRCTLVDEDAVVAEASERAKHLLERGGMAGLREPWNRSRATPSPV